MGTRRTTKTAAPKAAAATASIPLKVTEPAIPLARGMDFDVAAKQAIKEYPAGGTEQQVANWWKKFYPYAGHKRLGRFLASRGI